MTDEEFKRLKEAEKEHLRVKKKLQATLNSLRRKKQVRSAVDRLARSAQSALDRASDLIDRLATETARDEARLDVALDEDASEAIGSSDADVDAFEKEHRAEQARELIRQMKQVQRIPSSPRAAKTHHDSAGDDDASADASPSDATSSDDTLSTSPSDELPEKTIGRMRPDA